MPTPLQTLQETLDVYHHIYGELTSKVTCDITLAIVGHVVTTMWIVSKLQKAFNPMEGIKSTSKFCRYKMCWTMKNEEVVHIVASKPTHTTTIGVVVEFTIRV